ncbi:hypothetical protein EOD42_22400 [Rhodovarius crocodyli]|uniref:Uncharacterized protein n=1 Tax=Rhodovarius crocodyli TaxID=1979269 RepID=A0A437M113_9PROT|nr:hypothetical protein [Rhodovarius crocodyli]RVT91409.1 hypothetical protein EOD42_22400 [Rhodovarius crocodyli]
MSLTAADCVADPVLALLAMDQEQAEGAPHLSADELIELECRIVETPATTVQGIAARFRRALEGLDQESTGLSDVELATFHATARDLEAFIAASRGRRQSPIPAGVNPLARRDATLAVCRDPSQMRPIA